MPKKAKVTVHPAYEIGEISPRIYSAFLEPIGNMVNGSMFNPKHMIGIDINEKALELAKRNMEENKIENVTLKCADATTYKGEEVDVIICNPPYFNTNKNSS